VKWQTRIRISKYVEDREVVSDERVSQTAEGDGNKDKLRLTGWGGERNQ
jgi:hypothetical protein